MAALSLGAKYHVGVALSNPAQIRYQAVLSLPEQYYIVEAERQIGVAPSGQTPEGASGLSVGVYQTYRSRRTDGGE